MTHFSRYIRPGAKRIGFEHEDDTLMVCRCDTPKLLVDLLQAFSKHGMGKKGSTTTTTQAAATQGGNKASSAASNNSPMTIFCAPNGITFHQQSSKFFASSGLL